MNKTIILSACLAFIICIPGLSQTKSRNSVTKQGDIPGVPGGIIGGVPNIVEEFPGNAAPKESKTLVKTKDGLIIGKRNEFIANCTASVNKTIKYKDIEVKGAQYCTCFTDNIIPQINSWEISKATTNNNLAELLINDKYYTSLQECFKNNINPGQNYKFGDSENIEFEKKLGVKQCTIEVLKNFSDKNDLTTARATSYCECATDKLIKGNYKIKNLSDLDDFNSPAFKEIIVPCIDLLFQPENDESTNVNNAVEGDSQQSSVPLVISGNLYKIKLSIAGTNNHFLLDTGATDLIINRETERALLISGGLKLESYLNKTEYVLANNQSVQAQMVRIENIVIGDYTVKNIIAAVIDDSKLICGNNFLEKFQKWEIDKKGNRLILYK